jgi:hypothetical protein
MECINITRLVKIELMPKLSAHQTNFIVSTKNASLKPQIINSDLESSQFEQSYTPDLKYCTSFRNELSVTVQLLRCLDNTHATPLTSLN